MADHGAATPPSKLHMAQVLQTVVPEHTQLPLLVSQVLPLVAHDDPLFPQVPLVEQICGWSPLHRWAPLTQVPMQDPPEQVLFVQVLPFVQVPDELQFCGV